MFDAGGRRGVVGDIEEAGLEQKNLAFFGVEPSVGWVEIRCSDRYAYATVIDNVTGYSVYRAAITQQSSIP